jgi:hypothetical protein
MASRQGMDTFRSSGGSLGMQTWSALYSKNEGVLTVERDGLATFDSPITGGTLVAAHLSNNNMRDPISGTTMKVQSGKVVVTAPCRKQNRVHSRSFYVTTDVDVTIQEIRMTKNFSSKTNEKIGTAGKMTGMDGRLQMTTS